MALDCSTEFCVLATLHGNIFFNRLHWLELFMKQISFREESVKF